jgi:hypothetical protein
VFLTLIIHCTCLYETVTGALCRALRYSAASAFCYHDFIKTSSPKKIKHLFCIFTLLKNCRNKKNTYICGIENTKEMVCKFDTYQFVFTAFRWDFYFYFYRNMFRERLETCPLKIINKTNPESYFRDFFVLNRREDGE